MNTKMKMTGLACVLGAQLACAPMDGEQVDDEVVATQSELVVNTDGTGKKLVRSWPNWRTIKFCIATVGTGPGQFPTQEQHDAIYNAYDSVGTAWSQAADVGFQHVTSQDATCNGSNTNVEYNIIYNTNGVAPGQAITTYPSTPGQHLVSIGAWGTPGQGADIVGQAIHEFGHALGFLHENQASAAGSLTGPDPFSIMDSDAAVNTHLFTGLTTLDRVGVAKIYGSPVQSLGKPVLTIQGRPAISTWGSGHFDVFVRGSDSKLYWRKTDNNGASWSAWTSLGGNIASPPEAVSWGPGRIDVFARGAANDLQHVWYTNGNWNPWDPPLASNITGSPAVASWAAYRLDVFYRSTAGQLMHRWYDNGWGATTDNWGGSFNGSPSAVSWGVNRLDVVVRGTAGDVQLMWWNGTPHWDALGLTTDEDPGVSSWGAGRLDIFARQSNQNLWHTFYDNNWNGNVFPPVWENLAGHLGSGPYPVSLRGLVGQINIVTRGSTDGDVQFNYRDPADGLYKSTPGLVHINCGDNGAFSPYTADANFSGGSQKTRAVSIDTRDINGPAPADVYKSQHYGSTFTYTIPGFVAGSGHVIRLHWAETNPANNHNDARKFNVKINGIPVVWDMDIYKRIGLNHAYTKDFPQTANSAGKYVIDFTTTTDAATISGIEVF